MKYSTIFASLLATGVLATPMTKRNSNSWGGTNLYFLQGLTDAVQNTYINNLKSYGAKTVRVWVTGQPGGSGCQKGVTMGPTSVPDLETTLGVYNKATLDALDATLCKLSKAGLKAIISPHDANLLAGSNGNDIYGKTYGSATTFYTKPDAFQKYDARLSYILNYKSPCSGKAWKDWSEAIMAFDIQNEPFTPANPLCLANDKAGWLCGRAQGMRKILGSSPIKVSTGGISGDWSGKCNLMPAALQCDAVDLVAIHRYAGSEASGQAGWSGLFKNDILPKVGSKKVYLEEWGVDSTKVDQKSEFPANTDDIDGAGVPWMYWQVLPPKTCSTTDSDNFGIFMNGGVDLATPFKKAAGTVAAQDWSGIIA